MNKYILLDEYHINKKENIVGFIKKDIFLELEYEAIEILEYLKKEKNLKTKNHLKSIYKDIDIDNFFLELENINVLKYVEKNEKPKIKNKKPKINQNIINIIYIISIIIFFINTIFAIKNFKEIFIIDFNKYNNIIYVFIIFFIVETVLTIFHEYGHYIAAKLMGIPSKIKISQRFIIFLVFECEMNQVWLLNRKDRFFPILGGIIIDNIITTIFIIISIYQNLYLITIILFIQYTKLINHLIIPFKTDIFYVILFYFYENEKLNTIIKISKIIGYIILIPIIILYAIQIKNITINLYNNFSIINTLLIAVIILLPVYIFLLERKKKHE